MKTNEPPATAEAPYERAAGTPTIQILLVDLPFGDAIGRHPEVAPWVARGWSVGRTRPRLVEGQGRRHLVVLRRAA